MSLFRIALIIGVVLLMGAFLGITSYWADVWTHKLMKLPIKAPSLSALLVINPLKNTAMILVFMLLAQLLGYNFSGYSVLPYPFALLLIIIAGIIIMCSVVAGGVEYILLRHKLKC